MSDKQTWHEGDPCPLCGGAMSHSPWFDNDWCDDCGHREPPIRPRASREQSS